MGITLTVGLAGVGIVIVRLLADVGAVVTHMVDRRAVF